MAWTCRRSLLGRSGSRGAASVVCASFVGLVACGGAELPPRIPSTEIHDRVACRVELVDLVISDASRAEKVRSLYVQIETLMLDAKKTEARLLRGLGAGPARSEAETREAFKSFRQAEVGALERYAALELEIRTLTTPKEFARLDAIK